MAKLLSAIDVNKAISNNLTLRVKVVGARRLALRQWIGLRFMRLAGWVIGVETCIELLRKDGSPL